MSRRAVCEKHKYGSLRGALRDGGPYSTTRLCVTGMFNVQEVKVPTRGPDRGNPTSKRQGLCRGAPRLSGREANARRPARGGPKEVIDAWRDRTKVKCRKAYAMGKPAHGGQAQYLSVVAVRIGNEVATKHVEFTQ
jgi:hypothetical protein